MLQCSALRENRHTVLGSAAIVSKNSLIVNIVIDIPTIRTATCRSPKLFRLCLRFNRGQKRWIKCGERGIAAEETDRLIASHEVEGTAVFDANGQHLGRVHHLMIDKDSGQVVYAVAAFGRFFGIGDNWVPLP
jgi:hypothetical protein